MPSAQHRFSPEPSSVGRARRFVRTMLVHWQADDVEFAASQALTELATNAVIHARTEFVVAIVWDRDVLRVDVHDGSVKPPVQRRYAPDAATGRGLALVERLCRSWGVDQQAEGKTVWCEITAEMGDGVGAPDLDAFLDADDELADLSAPTGPRATVSTAA